MSAPHEPPPSPTPPIRIVIADDDPLVRAGLRMILGGVVDIEVVGEVADGSALPEAVETLVPDLVLMDIRMPRVDGLAATEALRAMPAPPKILVLTTFCADEQVLRALRAGAEGFILKDTPPPQIVDAVRRVNSGEPILSPAVTRQLIDKFTTAPVRDGRRTRAQAKLELLSGRERDVAMGVGRGWSNAEIASSLFMSVATVKSYVSRILARLELANRVQLALLVHDAVPPEEAELS